jgi:2-polyprenyl-3-methyl-5-hydroxy-6-metoxy-1,4-benzoquinol methylase
VSEPCDLCGARDFELYAPGLYALAGARLDLVRCRSCSLVQVRPLPSPDAIVEMYGDDYFDKDYDSCLSEASYFDSFPRLLARYESLLDAIEIHQPKGELFEVGAAGGYFLKVARDRGWRVRGIEITREGTRHAREELGLDVEQGAFPAVDPGGGPVDVVYMGHVLEHMRSPASGIEASRALLRPGGLLVAEVPTYIDSGYFRALRRVAPALRALGRGSSGLLRALKIPAPGETLEPFHLYEFRRETLTRLLERFGYRVVHVASRVPKPERLAGDRDPLRRALELGFDALDAAALRLGLPGGNVTVFARRHG